MLNDRLQMRDRELAHALKGVADSLKTTVAMPRAARLIEEAARRLGRRG